MKTPLTAQVGGPRRGRGAAARVAAALIATLLASGCGSVLWSRTEPGELSGRLILDWYEPDWFVYTPDPGMLLRFVCANGDVVQPSEMLTDGGSIPRPFRAWKTYSPWGYAHAFVVHDWLFEVHRCPTLGAPPVTDYTLEDAADAMTEVMTTMMLTAKTVEQDLGALWSMHAAMQTRCARAAWDRPGCPALSAVDIEARRSSGKLKATFVVDASEGARNVGGP